MFDYDHYIRDLVELKLLRAAVSRAMFCQGATEDGLACGVCLDVSRAVLVTTHVGSAPSPIGAQVLCLECWHRVGPGMEERVRDVFRRTGREPDGEIRLEVLDGRAWN